MFTQDRMLDDGLLHLPHKFRVSGQPVLSIVLHPHAHQRVAVAQTVCAHQVPTEHTYTDT
jgi:hypothetical protein